MTTDSAVSVPAIGDVVREVKPAVVQITNEQTAVGPSNQPYTVPAGVAWE
ncbi:MAG: hypothetical protein R2849_22285 [Thermomicrobiales bacterium]